MKPKTKKVFNIVSNVIFAVVMVILVIFMVYGFGSIANNKVPSFFGQSYVRISSGSMSDPVYSVPDDPSSELISEGFEVGDVAVIKKVNVKEIEVGDIVAFYTCDVKPYPPFTGSVDESLDFKTGKNSFDTRITFHQVVDILYGSDGYIWYQTKGTHNGSVDVGYTRSDYVVGIYTDSALAGVLQFISSPAGIIVLVVVPSCIVLFILLMNIIDTIDKMIKKKREEEAFQDALIKSVSDSNATTAVKKEQPASSLGGLTESSMADFEREMAKIEKEKGEDKDAKVEPKTDTTATNNVASGNGVDAKVPPKKPVIQPNQTVNASAISATAQSAQTAQGATTAQPNTAKVDSAKPAEVKTATAAKPAEVKAEPKAEAKPTASAEAKPAVKTEVKPATAKTETKVAEPKPATQAKAETKPASPKAETKASETAKPAAAKAEAKVEPAKTATKTESKATTTAKPAASKATKTTATKTTTTKATTTAKASDAKASTTAKATTAKTTAPKTSTAKTTTTKTTATKSTATKASTDKKTK